MIYDVSKGDRFKDRVRVLDYLRTKKYKRVLDIGGTHEPWAKEFVNAYIDVLDPVEYRKALGGKHPEVWLKDGRLKKSEVWVNDLDDDMFWREFLEGLQKPYDFVICSHVLEHVSNPYLLLRNLPIIAKEGWIAIPTTGLELKLRDSYGVITRGAPWHRWICVLREEGKGKSKKLRFWMYPKWGFVHTMDGLEWADKAVDRVQVSFFWKKDLPYEVYMEGHLPVTADKSAVLDTYREVFRGPYEI